MMATLEAVQKKFSEEVNKYKLSQRNLQKQLTDREQYASQLLENESVLSELKLLQDGSKVFKLIGPALVKQDLQEAIKNVNDRIAFIEGKTKSLDATIVELEKEIVETRNNVMKMEQQLKSAQVNASGK